MTIDFINQHIPNLDYASEIARINFKDFSDDHKKIVDQYITPRRSYVRSSARGILAKEVSHETLAYIFETCHQCTENERFRAMVVCLNKFYQETKSVVQTEALQKQLIGIMKNETSSTIKSFDWVDKFSNDNQVFYLLEITIGRNKVYKYGITSNRLRQRLASLKSDIKSLYNKQSLNIVVLLILECSDNKAFEDEIKILISENNLKKPNYDFKGSTELLNHTANIYSLIDSASKNHKSKKLYDSRDTIKIENNAAGF